MSEEDWDTHIHIKPKKVIPMTISSVDVIPNLNKEIEALQRKLDTCLKALNAMSMNGPYDSEDRYIPDEVLKQLEGE